MLHSLVANLIVPDLVDNILAPDCGRLKGFNESAHSRGRDIEGIGETIA